VYLLQPLQNFCESAKALWNVSLAGFPSMRIMTFLRMIMSIEKRLVYSNPAPHEPVRVRVVASVTSQTTPFMLMPSSAMWMRNVSVAWAAVMLKPFVSMNSFLLP
jgi:hypothetical protein